MRFDGTTKIDHVCGGGMYDDIELGPDLISITPEGTALMGLKNLATGPLEFSDNPVSGSARSSCSAQEVQLCQEKRKNSKQTSQQTSIQKD
jgi:hypothetical protein